MKTAPGEHEEALMSRFLRLYEAETFVRFKTVRTTYIRA